MYSTDLPLLWWPLRLRRKGEGDEAWTCSSSKEMDALVAKSMACWVSLVLALGVFPCKLVFVSASWGFVLGLVLFKGDFLLVMVELVFEMDGFLLVTDEFLSSIIVVKLLPWITS